VDAREGGKGGGGKKKARGKQGYSKWEVQKEDRIRGKRREGTKDEVKSGRVGRIGPRSM